MTEKNSTRNCIISNSANFHQDGGWTVWSQWSECQGYCSAPTRKRTRACTNPRPYNCGQKCNGADTEYDHTCIPQYCTSGKTSLSYGSKMYLVKDKCIQYFHRERG